MDIGGAINLISNLSSVDNFGEGAAAYLAGAGNGALTATCGPLGALGGGMLTGGTNNIIAQTGNGVGLSDVRWGQVGLNVGVGGASGIVGYGAGQWAAKNIGSVVINGTHINSPVLKGAVSGAIGGAAGGYAGGFVGGYLMTGDLYTAQKIGMQGFYGGISLGGFSGGIGGYSWALKNEVNPWTGKPMIQPSSQPVTNISEGTLTKGQIRSNVSGDYELAVKEWNNIQQQYGIPPTEGIPSGFTTTYPNGTTVSGQFYYGGTTNPSGYNIKVIMTSPSLQINKIPSIHIRYNNN